MMHRGKLRFLSLSSLFGKLRRNSSYSSYSCVDLKASSGSTVESSRSRYCLGGSSGRINLYPPWVKALIESLDGGDVDGRQVNFHLYPLVKLAMASLDGGEVARRLKFSECVKSYGFSHSLESFAMLAGIFSSADMYGEVQCLFRSLADFCRCYYWELLLVLLNEILHLSSGSMTPSRAYGCLLLALDECSMGEQAHLVHAVAEGTGIEVRVPLSHILLKRLVVGDLFSMVSSANVYMLTIIMVKFNTEEDRSLYLYESWKILTEMEEEDDGIGLAYGTYLLGLCVAGRFEDALELVCEMQERGRPCNYINCYNALMHGFCIRRGGRGDTDKCLMVFEMMKDSPDGPAGLSPDLNSYTLMIDSFCNMGDLEKAYELLYEMEVGRGITPPTSSPIYASLVRSSFLAGDVETTEKAFCKIKTTQGGEHDPFIYFILLHRYFRCGNVDAFHGLWEEMIDYGFEPAGIMDTMEFIAEQVADFPSPSWTRWSSSLR